MLENGAGGFKCNYSRVEWQAGRVAGEGTLLDGDRIVILR